jgi:hypothetical protein
MVSGGAMCNEKCVGTLQQMQVVDTRLRVKEGLKNALSSFGACTRRSNLILESVCCSKGADRF